MSPVDWAGLVDRAGLAGVSLMSYYVFLGGFGGLKFICKETHVKNEAISKWEQSNFVISLFYLKIIEYFF